MGFREDDLGVLYEALYPVRNSYKSFGLQIGVKKSEIESIEAQQTHPGERLLEILAVRVKKTEGLTWRDIDKALRSDCVGEGKLADEVYTVLMSPLFHESNRVHEEECAIHQKQCNTEMRKAKMCEEELSKDVADYDYSGTSSESEDSVYRREARHSKAVAPNETESTGYKVIGEEVEKHRRKDQCAKATPIKEQHFKHNVGKRSIQVGNRAYKATHSVSVHSAEKGHKTLLSRMTARPLKDYGVHNILTYKEIKKYDQHQHSQGNTSSTEEEQTHEPCLAGGKRKSRKGRGKYVSSKREIDSLKWKSSHLLFSKEVSAESSEVLRGKTLSKGYYGRKHDSLADSDTVSDTEDEYLIKVFSRCFGKLCCAITNPVETAAQLQEKGLISQQVMKDMIMSPESSQTKTVALIGAIQEKIHLRPKCVFVVIEVLLKSDVPRIKREGEEMLRKTGKVVQWVPLPFIMIQNRNPKPFPMLYYRFHF